MMADIHALIHQLDIPLLVAFLAGLLTAISPCPLATNIAALAFISKKIASSQKVLIKGLYYCLGRMISYTLLATLIYFGWSTFAIASIFQGWGDKILGPVLIIISLIMLKVIKIDFLKIGGKKLETIKLKLANEGNLGALLLGCLFALAFCPYSGVLFFGILIPLTLNSPEGLLLPPIFAISTGLPVIIIAVMMTYTVNKIGALFNIIGKIEKYLSLIVAIIFLLVGIYYLRYTISFFLASIN